MVKYGNIITINGGLKSAGNVYDEIIGDKYIKRIGEVDLGSLSFTDVLTPFGNGTFKSTLPNDAKAGPEPTISANIKSSVYSVTYTNAVPTSDKVIAVWGISKDFITKDTSYSDASTFKSALSGVLLYYELAIPVEYELVEPIIPIGKAGITEARISPNTDKLSAPFCGDITYTLADIYVPELKSINYITKITEITWSELKSLRDGGNLTPGMQYRITDYQCTTTQVNTQSANHQFDIIVIADDVDKLNENARACLHDGDTYFANTKFESWELKYRLDNDTTEFEWADSTNGKGIIYWMKDEYDNECPYDFKNIQYKYNNKWMYTFNNATDSNNIVDGSIQGYTNNIINNKIKSRYSNNKYQIAINIFNIGCHHNTLKNNCYNNIFGNGCMYNILENNCYSNTFGNSCNNNILKICCNANVFNNNSGANILYNLCSSNQFGYWCQYNILYSNCSRNNFSNYCEHNILYTECMSNNFNTYCCYNTFENHCRYIYIGKSYVEHIIVESGNMNMTITSTQTTSSANALQNFKIAQGVNNTGVTKTISHDTVNDTFQTIYKPVGSTEVEV